MMKKILKRAISFLTIAAILATGLVSVLGSLTASAAEVVTEEWFYDFKSGTDTDSTMPAFMKAHPHSNYGSSGNDLNGWMTYSSDLPSGGKQTSFDENGLHYYSYYGNNSMNLAVNGDAWARGFLLWDADVARQIAGVREYSEANFGDGSKRNTFVDSATDANLYVTYGFWGDIKNSAGLIPVQDGLYAVTVKFKVSEMNTSTTRVDVGVGVANYDAGANGDWSLSTTNYIYDYATIYGVMDDWATLTVFVDGSVCKGSGNNYLKICVSNDKFTNDGTYNQIDFESVSVKRLYDAENNETGIRYVYPQSLSGNILRSVDVPGLEPVLMSANESVVLPEFEPGSLDKEFFRWLPYDISENIYAYYNEVAGYFANNKSQDDAFKWLSTYAGATFTPGAGAFGLGAQVIDAVAAPTTTTEYEFDIEAFLANKDALWSQQGSAYMSTGIYNTATSLSDGGMVVSDATGGSDAWFYTDAPYQHAGNHRLGFYTGLDTSKAGDWAANGLMLKNGYTYKFEMVYKVDTVEGATHKSVVVGPGYSIISNNVTTWAETNSMGSNITRDSTDGYITYNATFNGDNFNDGHYLCINMSCNGNNVSIKSIKVTETFVGTAHMIDGDVETGTTFPQVDKNALTNGYAYTGEWYADEACTVPVTKFNSKVREIWAGTEKIFDVTAENGDVVVTVVNDDLIINVKPDAGYKLAANGLSVTLDSNVISVIAKGDAEDADGQGSGTTFMLPADQAGAITNITAEFVAEDATSIDLIAASIREGDNAGLRFRGRVTKGTDVKEVGFVLIPTDLLDGELNIDTDRAVIGKTAFDETIYDETEAYKDFQVKLTGLNDKLMDTEISCVMYVMDSEGAYTYSDISAATYNTIKAIYDAENLSK